MPQDRFNTKDTAELLRVSKQTLVRWVKEGKIAYIRTGRFYWFSQETIEKLLEPHIHAGKE